MSFDVSLLEPDDHHDVIVFDFPHEFRGGTYAVGGTANAELNVTYNYSKHYHHIQVTQIRAMPEPSESGLRILHGMLAKDSIVVLAKAIAQLDHTSRDPADYWAGTEGNAREALVCLLCFAIARPDGIWSVH